MKKKFFFIFLSVLFFINTVNPVLAQPAPVSSIEDSSMLDNVDENSEAVFKPGYITVNFKEADIRAVLNYISDVAGVDIVPAPDVRGNITMRLTDKPWRVAIDILVRNYGYVLVEENGVIRVVRKESLETEATITEVVELNYIVPTKHLSLMDTFGPNVTESGETAFSSTMGVEVIEETIKSILAPNESVMFIPNANAFVITAIPPRIARIKEMIRLLDTEPKQIMLEAKIIEVELGDDERLGIDWNAVISASGAKRPITFPFGDDGGIGVLTEKFKQFLPGTSSDVVESSTQKAFPYVVAKDSEFSSFTYGTLDFSQFTAVLSMLNNRDDTKILSTPRVTTLNNEEAYISVTDNVYLEKVSKTDFDASTVGTEFETDPRQSGVVLQVIPHANSKEEISVTLKPTIGGPITFETITSSAVGLERIAMKHNERTAHTRVMVKNGQTIFIGGLIKEDKDVTDHRLPILGDLFGDLPYIGYAFKYEAETITRTEIVIFVTVHIVGDIAEFNASATKDITNNTVKHYMLEHESEEEYDDILGAKRRKEQESNRTKKQKPWFDFRKKKA
ncbi:MAG: hypothetical protein PHQ52_01030 [Candidatus Omnitrophica bacterium]|nr:hypothetical protein [Candidatus Omnitrophota bacterium]